MTKRILSLAAAIMLMVGAKAQSIQETTIKIGDFTAPAYTVTLDQDGDLVKDAMKARLKEAKLKTKNADGYVACLDQVFSDIVAKPINFYTKVEGQGKKDNKTAIVTVAAICTDLTVDQTSLTNNVKNFLQGFVSYSARFEAAEKLEDAQKALKKAEKAYNSAVSDKEGLEKDIQKSQDKINDKKNDIEGYNEKIKKCQEDIKAYEADIQKYSGKRSDYEKKVSETEQVMKQAQAEVEKYQRLTQ